MTFKKFKEIEKEIEIMLNDYKTLEEIGNHFGVTRQTVSNWLHKYSYTKLYPIVENRRKYSKRS